MKTRTRTKIKRVCCNVTTRRQKRSKRKKNSKKYNKKLKKNINQTGGNVIDGLSKSVLNPAIKAVGSALGTGLGSIFSAIGLG